MTVCCAAAWAQPTGGVVSAGTANISSTGNITTIVQGSSKVGINWQSFSIGAGQSVQFIQPDSSSVALNRVIGGEPSAILGNLSANGKVFLVNPNGILFGRGASVNVGGLLASTLNLSDADLMAGKYAFSGSGSASVSNQGTISSTGNDAYVVLQGASVSNDGNISAPRGTVGLVAANEVVLDLAGDGLVNFSVKQGALQAQASNGGLIQADGGQVLISAQGEAALMQSVVNNSGLIEAHSIDQRAGVIRLLAAGQGGSVQVGGTLDVSGTAAGQHGGAISIRGAEIRLDGTSLQASGDAGGGKVLVGGDEKGLGTEQNARSVSLNDKVVVHADAMTHGDGGKIVVWSDESATIGGLLTARGGAASGKGGFIETSGKTLVLNEGTTVNTLAPHGNTGLWLLDPLNWTIGGGVPDETAASVVTSLAISDRLITATNDITVAGAVTWVTGQKLELRADHDVNVNAAMTASTNGSTIVLAAGNDVRVAAAMTASAIGSRIIMTATNDIVATAALTASALNAKIDLNAGHNLSLTTATADGGGSIDLRAKTNISIGGAITSDTGTVSVFADNDGSGPGPAGGTVTFVGPATISAVNTVIRFNPATYADTTAEIANYLTKVVAGGFDAKAWVFPQGASKVYDATTAVTLTLAGNPGAGNLVSMSPGSATFGDKNVGGSKSITYAGATLSGADATKFALFAPLGGTAGSGTTTGSITQRGLTVSAAGIDKTYDGNTTASVTLSNDAIGGDSVSAGYANANFADKNVGNGQLVSVSGISVSGSDAGNYSASSSATTSANIAPAPLTVTASDLAKPYGQVVTPAGFTTAGLVAGETIASVTETSTGVTAAASVSGNPHAIVASNAQGGSFLPSNYAITYVNGALTITSAGLTVTANDATKTFGQTPTLSGFTTSGLLNGDTVGSVTETSPGRVATASVAGSIYPIIPTNATGGTFNPANYTITYVNGGLTVIPAGLIVTANDLSKIYGQTVTLGGFSTIGLRNGDTIGSVTETSVGNLASASIAGSNYPITSSNATGGSFTPANYTITYVNGSLTVIPAGLIVTANDVTKTFGQSPALTGFTTTGLVNGDTVGSVTEHSAGQVATASVAGSIYAITPTNATGGSFTPGNYTISYVNGGLTVIPAGLIVTAYDLSKVYGQTVTPTGFSAVGLLNGDTVGSVTETSPGQVATASVAGSIYPITPTNATGGSFTPANYTISYVNGGLTVTPAQLTVTANDVTKIQGQDAILTGFTTIGTMNGDVVSSVSETSPSASSDAVFSNAPSAITPTNAVGVDFVPGNYVIQYVDGVLTVIPLLPSALDTLLPERIDVPPGSPVITVAQLPPELQTLETMPPTVVAVLPEPGLVAPPAGPVPTEPQTVPSVPPTVVSGSPEPVPVPMPTPVPTPVPMPVPMPVPTPVPTPMPVPEPEPVVPPGKPVVDEPNRVPPVRVPVPLRAPKPARN